jgi:hypothetical protein
MTHLLFSSSGFLAQLPQGENVSYRKLMPPYRKEIQSQPTSRNSSIRGKAKMNQEPKFTTSHCGKKLGKGRR